MVGSFFGLMNLCHVSCIACVVVVTCLGNLVCFWDAGSVSVVASVDNAISSLGWGRGLSLCVVLRVPPMRQVLIVVLDPLVMFVFLVFGSSRSSLPPIGGPNALGVYLRIEEVGI